MSRDGAEEDAEQDGCALALVYTVKKAEESFSLELAMPAAAAEARPSLIPSLCTHFTRAGIEWRR